MTRWLLRGAASFAFVACACAVAAVVDSRILPRGEGVWLKPLRFALSFAIHSATLAVLWGVTARREQRDVAFRLACNLQVWVMVVELACVVVQAARGVDSHFNAATGFDRAVFTIMGLGTAGLFIGFAAMAVDLYRRPGESRLIDTVVLAGLALSVLGGLVGVAMVEAFAGHAVGPGGGRVAFFGWRLTGGDLRIPHFVGLHALQALPLIAWMLERGGRRGPRRWFVFAACASAYLATFVAALVLALSGRSPLETLA